MANVLLNLPTYVPVTQQLYPYLPMYINIYIYIYVMYYIYTFTISRIMLSLVYLINPHNSDANIHHYTHIQTSLNVLFQWPLNKAVKTIRASHMHTVKWRLAQRTRKSQTNDWYVEWIHSIFFSLYPYLCLAIYRSIYLIQTPTTNTPTNHPQITHKSPTTIHCSFFKRTHKTKLPIDLSPNCPVRHYTIHAYLNSFELELTNLHI